MESPTAINVADPEDLDRGVLDSADAEVLTTPLTWPYRQKWLTVAVLSSISLAGYALPSLIAFHRPNINSNLRSNFGTLMCAPSSTQILKSLGSDDELYATLIVSIWALGEGIGPLLIAPLSELYGRRLIYNAANIAFVLFIALSAASVNFPMLIVMRFLSGMAVASVTLNPCVIGDLFVQEERGKAMSLVSVPQLLGPVAGPIIGGYVAQDLGWRWVFGLCAMFAGACALAFLLIFRETYQPAILRSKAAHSIKEKSSGITTAQPEAHTIFTKEAVKRPLRLLFRSPIVAILTIYISLVYGYVYIVFTTLGPVFQDIYHFPYGPVGLTYLGVATGIAFGVFLCGAVLDRLLKMREQAEPELRLPVLTIGSVAIVAGLLLFGWSAEARLHWMAPIVGIAVIGLGLVTTMISINSYLVDAFPSHAASALAAVGILRSLSAAGLPLVGPPLYQNLGLGNGNTVLACIAAIGIPITFLLMRYGKKLRKYPRDIAGSDHLRPE